MKKSIGNERLSFTELSTVLFEIENLLNNRSLCFMYGRRLEFENKCVDEGYFEVAKGNELWLRKCAVQNVVEKF